MAESGFLSEERQHLEQDTRFPNVIKHDVTHQQYPLSWYARWVDDWWLSELIGVLCSCALVVALCIILKKYDGEEVPSFGTWFNSGITLGTLVALLTTLAVAMALSTVQECLSQLKWLWCSGSSRPLEDIGTYDRASRGLWDSVQLIWKLRLTPTASFGALLTIAHLAIAPLTQQSLLSVSIPVVAFDGEAVIPASKDWTEALQQTQTLGMSENYASISAEMKGAVLNGIYTSAEVMINDTLPTCTTGNCTFPVYQSLAVCASTADVTSHLQNMTTKEEMKWCLPGGFCTSTNFTTNRVLPLVTMANISSAVTRADANAARTSKYTSSLNYTSLAFANHPNPIADFYIIYYNVTQSGPIVDQTWAAVEFALDWCVPTFTTSVTNGTATTSRLPTPFMDFEVGEAYSVHARLSGEDITVFSDTHASLQRYLNLTFSSIAYRDGGTVFAELDVAQKLSSFFGIGGQGTDLNTTRADGIAKLQDMLSNTATNMTNYMRSTRKVDSVKGTAYVQQNVISVRWGWVAAPIVFSAASMLFFLAVVVLCSIRQTTTPPLWKSSAVATMRCLDPELHNALGGAPGKLSVCGHAGRKSVRLSKDGEGWLLLPGSMHNR